MADEAGKAEDKVSAKADKWYDARQDKIGKTGKAKEQAQSKLIEAERGLAEAIEEWRKKR